MTIDSHQGESWKPAVEAAHSLASEHDDDAVVDLLAVPAFQRVEVRPDVVLRPLEATDAPEILAILEADPTIRERVSVAAKFHTEEDVAAEVEKLAKDPEAIRYGLLINGEVGGLVSFWKDPGFFGQTPEPDGYGFGYFIDPKLRGRGIVTDSIKRLMEVAKGNIPVQSFVAFCEDDNLESIAILHKLGLKPTEEVYGEPNNGWLERKHKLVVEG